MRSDRIERLRFLSAVPMPPFGVSEVSAGDRQTRSGGAGRMRHRVRPGWLLNDGSESPSVTDTLDDRAVATVRQPPVTAGRALGPWGSRRRTATIPS